MESTETLHFDFERVGSTKRRISSILKAPRTSVKETESSLKEPQHGDKSKPTEKRRSSRRVSFAATKNVVVFSKDMTSSSDEQSPILSSTCKGADSQDANKSIYDGMENLLKAPLQVPQKDKIQFFLDPVLSDYCEDKTVLFGEDTACMDMTHCHTILIDKDSDKSDLNFTINTEMSVSKFCKPTDKEDAMLQKNIRLADKGSTHFLNAEPASEFEAFLASVSQQKAVGNNTKNQKPSKARDQTLLFGGDDTECMDMTHCHTVIIGNDLNETDLNFTKMTDMTKSGIFKTLNREGNIQQGNIELPKKADTDADFGAFLASLSKGFGNDTKNEESCPAVQSSSVPFQTQKVNYTSFLASLNARRTVIDKENQPPAQSGCSVSKPQGLNLRGSTAPSAENDFMDLTKSYTVTIDGKGVQQSQQAAQAEKPRPTGLASTNASLKSPEPDDMDFTCSQTVAITFKNMDVLRPSLSSVRRGKISVLDPNKTQIFSADDTGMELTGVLDGTEEQENIQEKMNVQTESRLSLSKPRGTSVQRAQSVSQQQRINFHNDVRTSDPAYTDDMEMTKSQTVVIDSKGCGWERPNKTRKSLSTNRSVMFAQNDEDMEFTEAITGHIEGRELGSESISMDLKIPETGDNFLWATAPDSYDMEITKSQTVEIDAKDYNHEKPVRKSLSSTRSVMFTQNDEGMELTEAFTGQIEANIYPTRRELDTQGVSMDLKTNQTVSNDGKSLWTAAPDTDDMEMTKSQTVVIDSKNYNQEKPVRSRKSLSTNKSVMFTQNDEGMELTEAFTGQIEANSCPDRRECDTRGVSTDLKINETLLNNGKSLWASSPDSDDMEMTRSQTVVIDSKHPNQVRATTSRKSLSTNKSVFFPQNDDHIEMTEALTGHIDANYRPVREGADQTSERAGVSFNQTVHQNQPYMEAVCSEADDMEITQSRAVVIDSKNQGITGIDLSYSSHMKIAADQTDFTESHELIKESTLRKSLSCVPSSLQSIMFDRDPLSERKVATADDMEITRSQTVVIDAKHEAISADGDPSLHTQANDCKNNICDPITDSTFSSNQMTSQANVLQMSTDCEDMGLATGKANVMDFAPTNELFPFVSLPAKPCESERIPNDLSSVTGQKNFFPSLGVDDDLQTSSKHVATDSQVTKSLPYMATESKSHCSLDEGYDTKMKSAKPPSDGHYSAQLQEEDVGPTSQRHQPEVIGESSSAAGRGVQEQNRSPCADENVDSAQPDPVSPSDHTVTKRSNTISQKANSRRKSILDLQSKLRRISQTINDPAQSVVDDSNVALPCWEAKEKFTDNPGMADATGCSNQKTVGVLSEQPDNVDNFRIANHEPKPLTARLSFGGFLPKLPTRPKPVIADHLSETPNTFKSNDLDIGPDATPKLLSNFEMYDLKDEQLPEMSSEEDLSVTVDDPTRREDGQCSASPLPDDLEGDVFSLTLNATKSLKRPCPEDGHGDVTLKQKRKQEVPLTEEMDSVFGTNQWDANATEEASNVMTKTIDGTSSSSNSTYLKSESTLDSTYKYSQCDSQISSNLDNEFDFYKKIEDGSITVNEFLRYFGITFIIHKPRPSALPNNCSPEPRPKTEQLLREMFIYQPKRRVYEAECEKLTRMIERLKPQMLELDQPLRNINESLLQELAKLSKEQLLSFGSKLKERKAYFRKKSKILSHEMKADMYSELVRTTQEAKQKLEEMMLETDTSLKDLDARIDDLEAELAAVDGALGADQMQVQNEVQLALKNKQEELDRLDGAVAEKQKQIVHMENEKRSKAEKLDRLQEEVEKLQKHTTFLHRVMEWKLSLKEDGRTRFSFLHNTLLLEVVHQPSNGVLGPNNDTEQKLLDVSFNFQMKDKFQCHHIMVHDLLSQVFNSETDWLKRYPTTNDIPTLLHDVSLVVSRMRLLGEEILRLKRWGALRLDILEINCADRQVQIVFSSLKAFVKFQLTLAVTCAYPSGGVKLHNFQNYIGNTRVDQIEHVLSSIEPAKGYLTKILKRIHDHLLV